MKLSENQICSAATGCAEIRVEPEGLFFDRMTAPLRTLYGASEGAVVRARCQTGVRLRFHSDTDRLRLSMRFGRSARPLDVVDLWVDGERWGSYTGDRGAEPWAASLFTAAQRLPRAFELYLPHCVESWVTGVEIADGAAFEPLGPEPRTWLAIGDSITQGMTACSPSRAYASLAARALGVNLHNTAVGGARFDPAAAEAAALRGDIVTVAFAANDWMGCKPLARYEADAIAFLDLFVALLPGVPLGILTAFPFVKNDGEINTDGVPLEAYRDVLRHLAPRYRESFLVEGPQLVPADPAFFVDGVHPNDRGMAAIADNLAPHLRSAIKRIYVCETSSKGEL